MTPTYPENLILHLYTLNVTLMSKSHQFYSKEFILRKSNKYMHIFWTEEKLELLHRNYFSKHVICPIQRFCGHKKKCYETKRVLNISINTVKLC